MSTVPLRPIHVHALPPEKAYLFRNATPRRLAAWAELHRALFPDESMPGPVWQQDVASYLFDRGYHPESIMLILNDAIAWGTVELSRELSFSEFDKRVVERLLPDRDSEWSNAAFSGHWALSL
jgi:hypothetical protein